MQDPNDCYRDHSYDKDINMSKVLYANASWNKLFIMDAASERSPILMEHTLNIQFRVQ